MTPVTNDDWGDPCPRCAELVFRLVEAQRQSKWNGTRVCVKCNGQMNRQEAAQAERNLLVRQWRHELRNRRTPRRT